MRRFPRPRILSWLLVASAVTAVCRPGRALGAVVKTTGNHVYEGACDGSAAVALSTDAFVVASDEDQVLRVYRTGDRSPVDEVEWSGHLALDSADAEADVEAAARSGDVVYWVTSHGRNSKGEKRPDRRRFFATRVRAASGGHFTFEPVGTVHQGLLDALVDAASLAGLNLKDAAKLAPEAEGGFNIEALASKPPSALWLGFRNPVPHGQALLVAIENPKKMLDGHDVTIGADIRLSLDGRGLRDLTYVPSLRQYLCLAGPSGSEGTFALYTWSGEPGEAPVPVTGLTLAADLHPEAVVVLDGGSSQSVDLELLSDDGDLEIDGKPCKKNDAKQRRFRSIALTLTASSS